MCREVAVRDEATRLHVARQVRVLVQSEERVSVVMIEGFQNFQMGYLIFTSSRQNSCNLSSTKVSRLWTTPPFYAEQYC